MKPLELTVETFVANVRKPGIVIIDFWASWCAPCRAFAPTFEAAAQEHDDVLWAKVDTDAQQDLASSLGIRSIPTLMVFRDGILLLAQPGVLPAQALEDVVQRARSLDMEDVKRRIAEADAAEVRSAPATGAEK